MKSLLLVFLMMMSSVTNAAIYYVTQNGAGTGTGTSWANAAAGTNLQQTIDNSTAGDQIWVACGTYTPTGGTDRSISFSMKEGVEIYGGFQGSENYLSDRDITCNSCSVLSGEIGTAGTADNSYTVVYNQDINSALLDGFVIRDGNDDRSPTSAGNGLGGGVYNHGFNPGGYCHPTIRNCFFTNNSASWGGGAFNNAYNSGSSNPTYTNCIFYQNHAYIEAGGMDTYAVGGSASPTLRNCIFYENTSATNVGAMYAWGGGGGLCEPTLINCAFINNTATNGHGGAFIADNIDENFTTYSGSCNVTLQNCLVWGNTATTGQPQFYVQGNGASQVIFVNSCIDTVGQSGVHLVAGSSLVNSVPEVLDIADPDGFDNCWLTNDDGLMPDYTGNLFDAGVDIGLPATDIAGNMRIIGGGVDIGPYETEILGALADPSEMEVTIYPNPAIDFLQLKSTHTIDAVTIYSMDGKIQLSRQVGQENCVLDVSGLSAGTYIIEMETQLVERLKFIKSIP